MAEPIFKVGDIVTIKKLSRGDDYRFGLNGEMIMQSGESLEIIGIEKATSFSGKLPDDGWKYRLKDSCWSWASSMFEDKKTSKVLATQCVIETKDSSIDAFIKKNECPILDFTL